MSDTSPEPAVAAPRGRFVRWFPFGIIAAEAIGLIVIQWLKNAEIVDPANSFMAMMALVALGSLLLFLWFVFLSPASPTLRRRTGIVGVVLLVAAVSTLRIDRISGDIHATLQWRWIPRADEALPKASEVAAKEATVDLTATTPYDSPQFMGQDRKATITGVELVRDWSKDSPKLLWRQPIGAGWSSYAVVGHFGVTQEQRGEEELVTCYDLNDGQLQWAQSTPVRFYEIAAGIGPRATPVIDEGKVYALGAVGHLYCLDGKTGDVIWQRQIVEETGAAMPVWGKSGSPLLYQNLVIVSAGGPQGKSLVAYDKSNGDPVWRSGSDASSYSSPALLTLCGVPQIVMINETKTSGHDPADGRMLWEQSWPGDGPASPNVAQPLAVGDDRLLLTKGYGVGSTLWQFKLAGDKWSIEPLWKNNNLKTKMTSAVVRGGYAYGLDEGTLTCLEIDTGKRMWKRGRYGHGQVLLVDDLLLVQSESGEIALVEASPQAFRELTRATVVEGQSWNYPVLFGNRLLVRTEQQAACYELPVVSP